MPGAARRSPSPLLSGFGSIRRDSGLANSTTIRVEQASDTTFNGLMLSHYSTGGAARTINFVKAGGGSLTMAGLIGKQTASGGAANANVNITVESGTLVLSAANTYTGSTNVNGGKLVVSGSTPGAGLVQVSAAATLGGGGAAGNVNVADLGGLEPGYGGDNHMQLASLTLSNASILTYDLAAPLADPFSPTPDPVCDHVSVTGVLTLDGLLRVNALPGFGSPTSGDRWLLMSADGGVVNGTLEVDTANSAALPGGLSYEIDVDSAPGFVYLTVVPEAGTTGLMLLGLAAIRVGRRRRSG